MLECIECGFDFHANCAHENDELQGVTEIEDEEYQVSPHLCPRCQGSYIEPHSKGFTEGYCKALALQNASDLTEELAEPLLSLQSHAGITLDLPSIQTIRADISSLLNSKYLFALPFYDERLDGRIATLTREEVIDAIHLYTTGTTDDIDLSGKYLAEDGALEPLLEPIKRVRLGIGLGFWDEDRGVIIDYVQPDSIAEDNNCECDDVLLLINGESFDAESIEESPMSYFTNIWNTNGSLTLTFKKNSEDEYTIEITEEDLELPEILHDVIINKENAPLAIQIASKHYNPSWGREYKFRHAIDQPYLRKLSYETANLLAQCDVEILLPNLKSISDKAAQALSEHRGMLTLGLDSLSEAAAEELAKHIGGLSLGLASLPDSVAEILSRHKDELSLNNVTDLSASAANHLAKHEGSLELNGLAELSDTTADALAKHAGDVSLDGLTQISDRLADTLSTIDGDIYLNSVIELSDSAAESLSKHKGFLSMDGLTTLSDSAATSLSKHQGNLDLSRLHELSDAAIESLSQLSGELNNMDPSEWAEEFRENMDS